MIIDFHTHTFPDAISEKVLAKLSRLSHTKYFTDGSVRGLTASMKKASVDYSVNLPVMTSAEQVEKVNSALIAQKETLMEQGILTFGGMHPEYENFKNELIRLRQHHVPGIKIHPAYQNTDIDDSKMMRIIDFASEQGLIVLTHAGIDIGYPDPVHCSPIHAKKLVDTLHPTHVILAHTGGWKQWDAVIELLTDPALYFDISFSFGVITSEQFLTILQQHGSKHLLFGTDSPWDSAAHTLTELNKLALTQEQMDDICYKNACRLLGLQEIS